MVLPELRKRLKKLRDGAVPKVLQRRVCTSRAMKDLTIQVDVNTGRGHCRRLGKGRWAGGRRISLLRVASVFLHRSSAQTQGHDMT